MKDNEELIKHRIKMMSKKQPKRKKKLKLKKSNTFSLREQLLFTLLLSVILFSFL